MRAYTIAAVALTVAAAGAGGAWLLAGDDAGDGILPYRNAAAVAEGKRLYDDHCAACHGARLQGEPKWRERDADGYMPAPPHDASGHTWHHPDAQLIAITALGTERIIGNGYRSRMPGFGEILSPDAIAAVLAYIKSTWPREIQERHDQINAAAP